MSCVDTSRLALAAVATVFLIVCSSCSAATQPDERPGVVIGTLRSLRRTLRKGPDVQVSLLQVDSGNLYTVHFCEGLDHVFLSHTGSRVEISYDRLSDNAIHTCTPPRQVDTGDGNGNGSLRRRLFTAQAPLTQPSYVVFIVTLCGYDQPASMTQEMVRDVFFGTSLLNRTLSQQYDYFLGGNQPIKRNISDYYRMCSYGKAVVNDVQVLGPLEIPCGGTLTNSPVNLLGANTTGDFSPTKLCDSDNLFKLQEFLASYAAIQGVQVTDYTHSLMILPRDSFGLDGCGGTVGFGTNGPAKSGTGSNLFGTGYIWSDGSWLDVGLEHIFHEAGHNYYMMHATVPGNCDIGDQCDETCTMGTDHWNGGIRCYNAPHAWQMGWAEPILELNTSNLRIAVPVSVWIPPQLDGPRSFVMASLGNPKVNPDRRLFVSVRKNKAPYDLLFPSRDTTSHVLVHSYDGNEENNGFVNTVRLAHLNRQQPWRFNSTYVDTDTNLVVSIETVNSTSGAVLTTFCRRAAATERVCGDKVDDDCDGLPDIQDPDCAGRLPPPRPPPSPRPPPGSSRMPPRPSTPRTLLAGQAGYAKNGIVRDH